MTELVVGKYKFYPYPKELKEPPPSLEELVELLGEAKAKSGKDVKTPSRSNARRRPRRNLHG
ncbi:MAG: hypothetical protein KA746_08900 [Pyrinomonadaceae bacterium]|nr:hypothetical protein [Pyrinomonadaceae bacterium]MBP6212432.1 hypothetical protein [Pyrinomonadaceae bacterium]